MARVIVHVAVEGAHAPVFDEPKAIGASLEEVAVVRDHHHRALIFVDRGYQRGARVDVEMVRRLVENKEMRRIERGDAEQEPRLFAAREFFDFGVGFRAGKAAARGGGAHLGLRRVRHQLREDEIGRVVEIEIVDLMLREKSRFELGGAHRPARARLQPPAEQFREGGFAVAIGAEQADAVVFRKAQRQSRQHDALAIADARHFPCAMIGGDSGFCGETAA